jgi:hypothetical protein
MHCNKAVFLTVNGDCRQLPCEISIHSEVLDSPVDLVRLTRALATWSALSRLIQMTLRHCCTGRLVLAPIILIETRKLNVFALDRLAHGLVWLRPIRGMLERHLVLLGGKPDNISSESVRKG